MMRLYFLLVCLAAWCTTGYFHPDEHFQILEFANWKMGGTPTEVLPWEFDAQMRPSLQPVLAIGFIRIFQGIGIQDPFIWAFLLRLGTGLATGWVLLQAGKRLLNERERSFFDQIIPFLWFLPMLSVRFSSEQTAALALLLALFQVDRYQKAGFRSALFWAGCWLGLSFNFRFQMAFAGLGLLAWLIFSKRIDGRSFLVVALGGMLSVGVGVLADRWFYGTWVLTPWNYFFSNVVEDKASSFGVSPFWWYLPEFLYKTVPPISILLLLAAWKKAKADTSSVFLWIILPFIVGHSLVAHKELRFLFPILIPFLLLATQGYALVASDWQKWRWWKPIWKLAFVLNIGLLVYATFVPLQPASGLLRYLWHHSPKGQVYALREHPYGWVGVEVWFYRPKGLSIQVVEDSTALSPKLKPGDWVIARNQNQLPKSVPFLRMYSVLPDWLMAFNFNNWQDRTRIDQVYEVKR